MYLIYFLQLHLLRCANTIFDFERVLVMFIFVVCIYIYIYIYIYIGFVTFIDNLFMILSVALKFGIKDKNYYKQILLITSVRVSKKNQFSKTSRTRNNSFLLILWDSVVKFKYFPPNIHHFCLSIVSCVMLPNKFNFCFACSKNWYVCFDANISCKLIFWRW